MARDPAGGWGGSGRLWGKARALVFFDVGQRQTSKKFKIYGIVFLLLLSLRYAGQVNFCDFPGTELGLV